MGLLLREYALVALCKVLYVDTKNQLWRLEFCVKVPAVVSTGCVCVAADTANNEEILPVFEFTDDHLVSLDVIREDKMVVSDANSVPYWFCLFERLQHPEVLRTSLILALVHASVGTSVDVKLAVVGGASVVRSTSRGHLLKLHFDPRNESLWHTFRLFFTHLVSFNLRVPLDQPRHSAQIGILDRFLPRHGWDLERLGRSLRGFFERLHLLMK